MKRTLSAALLLISGSCDALWGYTKVPTLDNNCQVGGVVCKPYEVCSADTEQCEQQVPKLTAAKPAIIFSNGDDQVTIAGSGFAPDTQVLIDDQPVTTIMINSSQEFAFKTPAKKTAQGWGTTPVKVEVRSGGKSTIRTDLISWASSVATFNAYTVPNIFTAGSGTPATIQIADVDGDSKRDIIARSSSTGAFFVCIGNGDGTFRAGVKTATNPPVASGHFIMADVDQDARPDIVYWSNSTGKFNYSLNTSNGNFSAETLLLGQPGTSYFLGSADLSGDGKSDLVVVNYNAASLFSLLADAAGRLIPVGTMKSSSAISLYNKFPLFADFDKDAKMDLLVSPGENKISALYGNNDGYFLDSRTYTNSSTIAGSAVADLNNDGYPDIVTVTSPTGDIGLYKNMKDRSFTKTEFKNISSLATFLMVSDLNGDKNQDIFVLERGKFNATGYAFMGYGDGTFNKGAATVNTTFPPLDDERFGDVDNDGRVDMALIHYGDNLVYVFSNVTK